MIIPELQQALLRWQLLHGLSQYFQSQLPVPVETYGGIQDYSIKKAQQLHMHCEGTSEYELENYALAFKTLLKSEGYTKNNLWWERLACQGDEVLVLGGRCVSRSPQDKDLCFAEFQYGLREVEQFQG